MEQEDSFFGGSYVIADEGGGFIEKIKNFFFPEKDEVPYVEKEARGI